MRRDRGQVGTDHAGRLKLADLEALARRATPGPWRSWVQGQDILGESHVETTGPDLRPRVLLPRDRWDFNSRANLDYIAALNPAAVLELIERVRFYEGAPPVEQAS